MRRLGRPPLARPMVSEIETLAASTTLSIREIQKKIAGKASGGVVGEISKRVRAVPLVALTTFYTYSEPTPSSTRVSLNANQPGHSPRWCEGNGYCRCGARRIRLH